VNLSVWLRATSVALLAGGLLVPAAAALAAPNSNNTGTVEGIVTCGAAEDAPAAHIVVSVEGLQLQTLTDGTGHYSLVGLPAGQNLTVDAIADPSVVASRFNVTVAAGQTLDIGSMDVSVCGQPVAPAPTDEVTPPSNGDLEH
jgi:hypothetical protein